MNEVPSQPVTRGADASGHSGGWSLVYLMLAAAGFLCVAALLRPAVPWAPDHQLAARWEHLAEHADDYDLVFFGASTVRRAFVPEVFDEESKRLGHTLRSFNLAVPGASRFEVDYLLRELLALRPQRLRWVVIEPHYKALDALVAPRNWFTDRAVRWHTPRQLLAVYRAMWRSEEPRASLLRPALVALRHALWRVANYGQAHRSLAHLLGSDEAERRADLAVVERLRGFEPLLPEMSGARRIFLENPDWYRGIVANLDRRTAPARGLPPDSDRVRAQIRLIRSAGAEPVYALTPVIEEADEIHTLHRAGVVPELIAFDSPRRYPELYDPAQRLDHIHLNETGARRFSRLFAQRFAERLESGRAD